MVVDENCKRQIITVIQNEINTIRPIFRGRARKRAERKADEFINSIPKSEFNLRLSDYLIRHPEVGTQYPAVKLFPQCTRRYTMQELIECLDEIKTRI